MSIVPRENLVGPLHGGWAITQGSLAHERAGLWVEGVVALRADRSRRSSTLARRTGRERGPDRAPQDRADLRAGVEPALARLPGLRVVRPGLVGARALVHEDGDVRSGQGRVRARHGDLRTVRRGDRRRARPRKAAAGSRASSCRSRTRSRADRRRSSATSSPSACWASRGADARSMDFTLTDDQQLLRDTARKLLDKRVPAGARARAHRRSRRVLRRCGQHLARVHRARPRPDDRPVPLPRGDRLRRRARTVPRDARCSARSPARTRRARSPIAGASGALDAERRPGEDVRARSRPRRTHRGHRRRPDASSVVDAPARRALRFVATVDFSRRVFELDTDAVALNPQPLAAEGARRVARPRATRRSRPRWSAPHGGSSRWRSSTRRSGKQFDVPIGSFQAIQHKLAEMSLALERATAAVHYAAMSVDADDADRATRLPRRQGRRRRSGPPHPQGRHPDPRRHRLHVGARPPPVPAPRHRRRVPARHHRLAPRPPRRPADRRLTRVVRRRRTHDICAGRGVRSSGRSDGPAADHTCNWVPLARRRSPTTLVRPARAFRTNASRDRDRPPNDRVRSFWASWAAEADETGAGIVWLGTDRFVARARTAGRSVAGSRQLRRPRAGDW